jgi:hypothetical protein
VRAAILCVLLAMAVTSCDADTGPEDRSDAPSVTASPSPGTPAFRFVVHARRIEATDRARFGNRDRRRVQDVIDTVRGLVTDLYVEGFLDPAGWGTGDYEPVFGLFAGGAREAARSRTRALTAGADAADRFTTIQPAGGGLWLRALVDRSGAASLVSGIVRFRARADGDEPTLFRSEATYLFRRTGDGWRIVAFEVVRRDRERAA